MAGSPSSSSLASDWISATRGVMSRTRDWASITLTSTVPSAGCSRTSHHKKLGSGIAPEAISSSTVST